jgi:hypothetical protein
MSNSILVSPRTLSAVGPVVPLVLHKIWCEQVVPPGGTGGTGMRRAMLARADRQSFMVVHGGPTGPTMVPPKLCKTACSTTGSTGPARWHGCPVSAMKNAL